jgi:hypothetical protein
VLSCATTSRTGSTTYFGFTVGLTNAPPPPAVRWDREPELVQVGGSDVYVASDPDDDIFRFGGSWYVAHQGYWYRSDRYNGPFVNIDVRSVPREIMNVPPEHWHHHHPRPERGEERHRD